MKAYCRVTTASRFLAMRSWLWALTLCSCLLDVSPLGALGFVAGRVYQRQKAGLVPVAGARVEAYSFATGEKITGATADAYGHYVLSDLPAGEAVLRVSHVQHYGADAGQHRDGARVSCQATGECGAVDFEMIPNADLAVRVVDAVGRPVDDVRITAFSIDGSERAMERSPGLRDARGALHISLPAGRYRVDAASAKRRRGLVYEPASMEVEIEHSEPSEAVEIVLHSTERFRVSGRVFGLDPAAAGVRGLVLVALERIQTEPQPRRLGAPLEKSGRFALHDVPRGSYRIELISSESNALPASGGKSYPLGDITVHANLRGLLFAAPPGTGGK
jgi:hypothetical protein